MVKREGHPVPTHTATEWFEKVVDAVPAYIESRGGDPIRGFAPKPNTPLFRIAERRLREASARCYMTLRREVKASGQKLGPLLDELRTKFDEIDSTPGKTAISQVFRAGISLNSAARDEVENRARQRTIAQEQFNKVIAAFPAWRDLRGHLSDDNPRPENPTDEFLAAERAMYEPAARCVIAIIRAKCKEEQLQDLFALDTETNGMAAAVVTVVRDDILESIAVKRETKTGRTALQRTDGIIRAMHLREILRVRMKKRDLYPKTSLLLDLDTFARRQAACVWLLPPSERAEALQMLENAVQTARNQGLHQLAESLVSVNESGEKRASKIPMSKRTGI